MSKQGNSNTHVDQANLKELLHCFSTKPEVVDCPAHDAPRATPHATIHLPRPNDLPLELRERPQWVAWTYKSNGGKLPLNAKTERAGKSNDPSTWSGFWTAYRYAQRCGCGIGFVFTAEDPYAGVDFDDCVDPESGAFIDAGIMEQVMGLDSYTEVSPSGAGVKVFVQAHVPKAYKKDHCVELYDRGRFFTMTGQRVQATPATIEHRQAEVEALVREIFGDDALDVGPRGSHPIAERDLRSLGREIARAAQALEQLAPWRCDDYAAWVDVGMALCELGPAGLGLWQQWSQRGDKYEPGECERKWASFTPGKPSGLTLASLHEWARQDGVLTLAGKPPVAPACSENTPRDAAAGTLTKPTKPEPALTDLGNCERFVRLHQDTARYCPGLGWLVWDGRRWAKDDTGAVMRLAKHTALGLYDETQAALQDAARALAVAQMAAAGGSSAAKDARDKLAQAHKVALKRLSWAEKSQARQRLEAMVALAQSEAALVVRMADLDSDPMLLNCNNGTLDLHTGVLREHRREDLLTKLAPVDFDPSACHPVWDAYLSSATGGDSDFGAYLQRWAGYCLTGGTGEEQVALLLGPASTGKTTLVEALSTVMGEYAQKASFDTFLERSHVNPGGARPDLARLPGVRLITACEASAKASLDGVMLKELSGGDTLTVRSVYKEPFSFKPQCKIVLASNEAPRVSDQDTGIWRRLRRLPFEHVIPEERRDPNFKATLTDPTAGGPAVLAWAVQGCLAWQRQGLGQCAVVRRRTQELRADMDPLATFFEDCCVFGPDFEVAARDLREVYEEWCRENGVRRPVGNVEWARRLEAKNCENVRRTHCGARVRMWAGIGLLSEHEDDDGTDGTDGGLFSTKLPKRGSFFSPEKVSQKSRLSVPSVPEFVPEDACSICGAHDWVWSPSAGGYMCASCVETDARARGPLPPRGRE